MDEIIDKLIDQYHLSDYEALVVTGIIGILAMEENVGLNEIYTRMNNKLKPIVKQIVNE